MDGSAAAAVPEDGGESSTRDGEGASENDVGPSIEDDTVDRVGVFCCQDCGEAFREEAAYLEHRQQHPHGNMCLEDHVDALHDTHKDNERPYYCSLCSVSFVELSEFETHMKTNHEEISQKESGIQKNAGITKQQTYECPDCGKSYCVIGHFLNHLRSHRQAAKSVFNDLEHLKKKSFQCEFCGRNYSRASALDAHRRCHEEKLVKSKNKSPGDAVQTGEPVAENKPSENQTERNPEKLFKCSCGKAFSALMRLKTHQRFSRNSQCSGEEVKQKPKKSSSCSEFYCSECKKNFSGHIALFNHQRWHANHSGDSANRFPCEECGKVFMTLTFYYRHQRTAHSDETPAKSFLHQVCQLQKKAFECNHCGLKFSRASALHSHQLHHTEVFKETEKEAQMHASLQPQEKAPETVVKEIEYLEASSEGQVESESFPPVNMAEEPPVDDNEEDMESYEPGDFNVQVISASESEDEPVQDLNPDLELLCESDQEAKDDGDAEVSKSEMDLKIVQIDFEQADEQCALIAREAENNAAEERYDCPECYRWFSNPSSLRVHRMWHGVHKRRQQTGQSVAVYTCDTCGHEAGNYAAHCNHIQTHNDQNTSDNVLYETEGSERKNLTCNQCGKCFSRMSALVSHQMHHPKRKQFQCPDCMMSYLHAASLFNHMKTCSAQKKENILITKREYNPKKTLLGPKLYYCEQCGKGFWSLGAYSHHKQGQTQCADLRLRKGAAGSLHPVNGHPRSSSVKVACPVCGRKFRHKGTMALHMRKHENGNHTCELCSRSFRLFSSLLRHQVVHSDQLLPPPVKSFQHQVEQLKKNTYSCPDCGKLFSRAKALQFHMKSHGYETGHAPSSPRSTATLEDLQCATCLAHFNNKSSLRAHQKLCVKRDSQANKEPERSDNDMILNSGSVDASTQRISEPLKAPIGVKNEIDKLENHTEQCSIKTPTTDGSKYKCNKCERSFSVIGALNLHKRVHIDSYKSVPKTKLSFSVVLKKPKQEEPGKGLFHCSECGRRFMSNSALGSHKRWHKVEKCSHSALKDDDFQSVSHKTEDGRFQCKKCGKQFFNHRVLQRHLMFNPQCQTKTKPEVNSDERVEIDGVSERFSCPECSQAFVDSSLLVAHYENEHCESLGAADRQGDNALDPVPEQTDVNRSGSESMSLTVKPKTHQCPLCSMTFAKARGLRAHKWQAHSKSAKGKNKIPLSTIVEPTASSSEVSKTLDSSDVEDTTAAMKDGTVGRGRKKINPDLSPVKFVSCLDCGKQCVSAGALLDHKKVCREVKQEPKLELQTREATAEIPPPLSRLLEHAVKCLFKCGKCGKAFQTEEQLDTHKTKAKSRPYSCALCCHGFWTENQLQQHLAWHDEVRCRLPNEVRYRLSAALTSKSQKQNFPASDNAGKSFPSSAFGRPSQSSHKCQHCGKTFLSPTALQKHKTGQCSSNDSYHCSVCPRTFSEIQDLIDHHQECISDYRSDAPAAVSSGDTHGLTCLECGATFCQETDLHQHYTEHAHGV